MNQNDWYFWSPKDPSAGHMKTSSARLIIILLLCYSAAWRCGNPVAPQGGPKDTRAPKAIGFDPGNYSVNFIGKKIRIDFDEFIAVKNQSAELSISPPLKYIPEVKVRGKSLLIDIEDTLLENTTYSFNFGNAISDITENNILTGFKYVLSTGSFIDSLSLKGKVINAYDLIGAKDVFAMLYIDNNDTIPLDSLPFKTKPYYVVKTNETGEFIFQNLKNASMKLMALSDQNGNLIIDAHAERVAFYDSLVRPYYIPAPKTDTSRTSDSLIAKKDTAKPVKRKNINETDLSITPAQAERDSTLKDSLRLASAMPMVTLGLFDDIDSVQKVQKSAFLKKGLIQIIFRFPVEDLKIEPLGSDSLNTIAVAELLPKKDSLYLWLKENASDTILLRLSQADKLIDTVRLEYISKEGKQSSRKEETKKVFLPFSHNLFSNTLNQYAGNLSLTFGYPLSDADFKRIHLMTGKDTLKPRIFFTDSIKRCVMIGMDWKEDKSYTLFIPDSVFRAINKLENDTIQYTFKTLQAREFGNIILSVDVSKNPGNYIVQLLNDKDMMLIQKRIRTNEKVKFEYLKPGKFKLKFIYDRNNNGRWDTGSLHKKLQPEKVGFLGKIIEIRSNWDVEESWSPEPAN